jgi:hypothetical protein
MLRSIPLRAVEITMPGAPSPSPATTVELLTAILTAPKKEGVQIDAMRKVGQILDALAAANDKDEVLLDEALWSFLNQTIVAHTWGFYSPAFVALTDSVANAAKIDPNT